MSVLFLKDIYGDFLNADYIVRITKTPIDSVIDAIYLNMADKSIYTFYEGKEADRVLENLMARLQV